MNREEFINYLYNPQLLDKTSLEGIKGVLERYPYFHTAHLLMVKNLKNTDDIHFAGQLNLSAAYAGDRDKMFRLVHDYLFNDKSTVSEKEDDLAVPVENFTEEDTLKETGNLTGSDDNREKETDVSDRSAEETEEDKPAAGTSGEESLADRILREIEEYKRKKERTGFADDLYLQDEEEGGGLKSDDPEEKVKTSAESPVEKDEVTAEGESEVEEVMESDDLLEFDTGLLSEWEKDEGTDERYDDEQLPAETYEENFFRDEQFYSEDESDSRENLPSNEAYSFSEWLELLRSQETVEVEKRAGLENEGSGIVDNPDTGIVDDQDPGSDDDLIDRFLEKKPRIEPREIPAEPGEETDISEGSATESEEFFTETLARIYIQQKHYKKAVYAYEKLSLKYPEKYSYFAKQIEEIERIINQLQ